MKLLPEWVAGERMHENKTQRISLKWHGTLVQFHSDGVVILMHFSPHRQPYLIRLHILILHAEVLGS